MSLSQVMAVLRARWIIVASIIGLAMLTAIGINTLMPKRYTAATKVMIDVKSPDPVAGVVLPGMLSPTYLATQGDVIKSGRVVERVIADMRLDQSPEMRQAWQEMTQGKSPFIPWLADRLLTALHVSPSRDSNVIDIDYTAETPEGAALFANAFTNAYVNVSADLRTEPAKAFGSSFETLAAQLRKRLLDAQSKLAAYQKEAGLMATDERLDVETDKLAQLSSQVTQLTAMMEDVRAKRQSARADGTDVSAEGMTNTVINSLRTELIGNQSKLSALQERYGDSYPAVVETKNSIAELKRRIDAEYARTSQFIDANSNVTSARLAAAKQQLEEQRQKLLELREKRSAAALLTRDVENLQRAYDVVQSRVSQAGMEVQAASTSLAVLEKAMPPTSHSTPRSFLNTVIAMFLGTILAVATAVIMELLDRRVRTNDDIQEQLGMPLVGVLLKTENAPKGLLTRKAPPWVIHRHSLAAPAPRA